MYKSKEFTALALAAAMLSGCSMADNVKGNTDNVSADKSAASQITDADGEIVFLDETTEFTGKDISVNENAVTISSAGKYVLSGKSENASVIINASDSDEITLVMNGIDITCADNSPLRVISAKDVYIELSDGTENSLSDGESYSDDFADACIYSKSDIHFSGNGTLSVNGNYKHGIVSKDDLEISSGIITVSSVSTGINGKDSVEISDGEITVNSGTNGIRSDNTDEEKGNVIISGGKITVSSEGDSIEAENTLDISGGEFYLTSGGGYENASSHNFSAPDGFEMRQNMSPPDDAGANGERKAPSDFSGANGENIAPPDEAGASGENTAPSDESGASGENTAPSDEAGANGENITPPDEAGANGENTAPSDEAGASGENTAPSDFSGTNGEMPQMPGDRPSRDMENPTAEGDNNTDGFGKFGQDFLQDFDFDDFFDDTDESSVSAKALKAGKTLAVSAGKFVIDSSDDALHSNGGADISGGDFEINAGDDGIHADENISIDSAVIKILQSYEGIEGKTISINSGSIYVNSSDDSINCTNGSSSNGFMGMFDVQDDVMLEISGGEITLSTKGDGIDSNGGFNMTGGTVFISGPENGGNGSVDVNGSPEISGGQFLACGAVGMEMGFADSSAQYSVLYNLSESVSAGEKISVTDSAGQEIVSFTPEKSYQSIVFSSPEIKNGEIYTITAGNLSESVEITGTVTSNSTGESFGGRGMKRGNMF